MLFPVALLFFLSLATGGLSFEAPHLIPPEIREDICPIEPRYIRGMDAPKYRPVRGGGHQTCTLHRGVLMCYGYGAYGILGRADGSTLHRGQGTNLMSTVTAADLGLSPGEFVMDAASGEVHTCALTSLGRVKCFGFGGNGQLGNDDNTNIGDAPGEVAALPFVSFWDPSIKVESIDANHRTSCAILSGAAIDAIGNPAQNTICWGNNEGGRLGTGDTTDRGQNAGAQSITLLRPIEFPNDGHRVVSVSAGEAFTCFLFDHGRVRCLGYNHQGSVGRNSGIVNVGDSRSEETCGHYIDWGTTLRAVQIAAGYRTLCALFESAGGPSQPNAGIMCIGRNNHGQVGRDSGAATFDVTYDSKFIEFADDGRHPVFLDLYYQHTCAIFAYPGDAWGKVRCWGYNGHGQLARGSTAEIGVAEGDMRNVPYIALPPGDDRIVNVQTGYWSTQLMTTTGKVYSYGRNTYGNLGIDNSLQWGDVPAEVGPTAAVAAGPFPIAPPTSPHVWLGYIRINPATLLGVHGHASFCPSRRTYDMRDTVTLPSGTTALSSVSAGCQGDGCTVEIVGHGAAVAGSVTRTGVAVPSGDSVLQILATAGDGVTQVTYEIHVRRALASDSRLSGVEIVSGESLATASAATSSSAVSTSTAPSFSDPGGAHAAAKLVGRESADVWGAARQSFDPATTYYALPLFGGSPVVHIRAQCVDPSCRATIHTRASRLGHVVGATRLSLSPEGDVGGATVPGGIAIDRAFGRTTIEVVVVSADQGSTTVYSFDLDSRCPVTAPGADLTLTEEVARDFQMDVGSRSGYVLRAGKIVAWGYNTYGNLGQDSSADIGDAVNEVSVLSTIGFADTIDAIQVDSGDNHACAVFRNGKLRCWGAGDWGALGYDSTDRRGDSAGEMAAAVPYVTFPHTHAVVSVSTGSYHTCAIFANGRASCWGNGGYGRTGLGSSANTANNVGNSITNVPFLPFSPIVPGATDPPRVVQIACGMDHTCALLEGGFVTCWGRDHVGQLARDTTTTWGDDLNELDAGLVTSRFSDTSPAVQISSGDHHSCAVFANGGVRCWGLNGNGQLGKGDSSHTGTDSTSTIEYIRFGDARSPEVDSVTCGDTHTCFRFRTTRVVRCLGYGGYGQLGMGDTDSVGSNAGESQCVEPIPFASPGSGVVQVSAGIQFNCAQLDGDGDRVRCWGRNSNGRLGLGIGNGPVHPGSALGQIPTLSPVDLHPNVFGGVPNPPSTDPALLTLTDDLGIIDAFCPAVTSYGPVTIDATNAATAPTDVTFTGTCRRTGCTFNGNFNTPLSLSPGVNTFTLTSTSASGTRTATYTITVRVITASSAGLLGLWDSEGAVAGGMTAVATSPMQGAVASGSSLPTEPLSEVFRRRGVPGVSLFDPTSLAYPLGTGVWGVTPATSHVGIRAVCEDMTGCTIKVRSSAGQPASRVIETAVGSMPGRYDSFSRDHVLVPLSLHGGTTIVSIEVTSRDGGSTQTYTVTYEAACLDIATSGGVDLLPVPSSGADVAWDMGRLHSCVIRDGEVLCWGYGASGQLGTDDTNTYGNGAGEIPAMTPITFGTTHPAIDINNGEDHTCVLFALNADATLTGVRCFGLNSEGQLGIGSAAAQGNNPGEMATLPYIDFGPGITSQPVALACGSRHSCALFSRGEIQCWGQINNGQLLTGTRVGWEDVGDNPEDMTSLPPLLFPDSNLNPAVKIDTGGHHTCVLFRDGRVRCFGNNAYGQLGHDNANTYGDNVPQEAAPMYIEWADTVPIIKMAAGESHNCFLFVNGKLRCIGRSNYGQLGYDDTTNRGNTNTGVGSTKNVPYLEFNDQPYLPVAEIAAGEFHSCALFVNGRIRCWGYSTTGATGAEFPNNIGNSDWPSVSMIPFIKMPPAVTRATAIRCGRHASCALYDGGDRPYCWGETGNGRLGRDDGTAMGNFGNNPGEMTLVAPVTFPASFGTPTSSDPFLADLSDNVGGILAGFCPSVTKYGPTTLDSAAVTSVTFSAVCRTGVCTPGPNVGSPVALTPGRNTIPITVTSASGTRKVTYTVIIDLTSPTVAALTSLSDSLGAVNTRGFGSMGSAWALSSFDPAVTSYPSTASGWLDTYERSVSLHATCATDDCVIRISPVGAPDAYAENTTMITIMDVPIYAATTITVTVTSAGGAGASQAYNLRYRSMWGCFATEAPAAAAVAAAEIRVERHISLRYRSALATREGAVVGWGSGDSGMLGTGLTTNMGDNPAEVGLNPAISFSDTVPAVSVSTGQSHSCALFDNGGVRCWGAGGRGQLGTDSTANIQSILQVSTAGYIAFKVPTWRPIDIQCGYQYTCVLMADGVGPVCFGRALYGSIGSNDNTDVGKNLGDMAALDPVALPRSQPIVPIVKMSVGSWHNCFVYADGRLLCFGWNSYGQLGRDSTENIGDGANEVQREEFVKFKYSAEQDPVVDVTTGHQHTCALFHSGGVICFGRNNEGELANSNTQNYGENAAASVSDLDYIPFLDGIASPVSGDPSGPRVASVWAAHYSSCVVLRGGGLTGRVTCWGYGGLGTLGLDGNSNFGDTPMELANLVEFPSGTLPVVEMSGGDGTMCALFEDDRIYCWGRSGNGQPGRADGSTTQLGDAFGEMATLDPVDIAGVIPHPPSVPTKDATLLDLTDSLGILQGFCPRVLRYGPLLTAQPSIILTATCALGTASCSVTFGGSGPVTGPLAISPALPLVAGATTTIPVVVTSQDNLRTVTYTLEIVRTSASDASLVDLTDTLGIISRGAPLPRYGFDPAVTTYGPVSVPSDIMFIDSVIATCASSGCTVRINGVSASLTYPSPSWQGIVVQPTLRARFQAVNVPLAPGPNEVKVAVTSQDSGTTKTYTLLIDRPCAGLTVSPSSPSPPAGAVSVDDAVDGLVTEEVLQTRRVHQTLSATILQIDGKIAVFGDGNDGVNARGSRDDIGRGAGVLSITNIAWITFATTDLAVQVDPGKYFACALFNVGGIRCWGKNNVGQGGQGYTNNIGDDPGEIATLPYIPFSDTYEARYVSAGDTHACAIFKGGNARVRCWGSNSNARLGVKSFPSGGGNQGDGPGEMATLPYIELPGDLDTGDRVMQVVAGGDHTCLLRRSGRVECMGSETSGVIGNNGYGDSYGNNGGETVWAIDFTTEANAPSTRCRGVSISPAVYLHGQDNTNCLIASCGGVRCWGLNDYAQLGIGHTDPVGTTHVIFPNYRQIRESRYLEWDDMAGSVRKVVTSAVNTCVLGFSGKVRCWGHGGAGQLGYNGIGPIDTSTVGDQVGEVSGLFPIDFATTKPVIDVSVGERSTCALFDDPGLELRCFGRGNNGQIGRDTNVDYGDTLAEWNTLGTVNLASLAPLPTSSSSLLSALTDTSGTVVAFCPAITLYGAPNIVAVGTALIAAVSASCAVGTCSITVNGGAPQVSVHAPVGVPLAVGLNDIPVVVTAGNGVSTRTYTLRVFRPVEPQLATLSDSAGCVATEGPFAAATTVYGSPFYVAAATASIAEITADCPSAGCEIGVSARRPSPTLQQMENPDGSAAPIVTTVLREPTVTARLELFGLALAYGLNEIMIVVRSDAGGGGVNVAGSVSTTYTLRIHRLSPLAQMVSVTDSMGLVTQPFDSEIVTYPTLPAPPSTVPSTVATIDWIHAQCAYPLCTVRIVRTTTVTGQPAQPAVEEATAPGTLNATAVPLGFGLNEIAVNVTSEDASTSKAYIIRVYRLSSDATLSALEDSLALVQGVPFSPATTSYGAGSVFQVPSTTASLDVLNATCGYVLCTIAIEGAAATAGFQARTSLTLLTGVNTFSVVVTSEDGLATVTYQVVIERLTGGADLTLASLTDSLTYIQGVYAPAVTFYGPAPPAARVPAATTTLGSMSATLNDVSAKVAINGGVGVSPTATENNIPLVVGDNAIPVVVTHPGPPSLTTLTYTVVYRRMSDDAALASMSDGAVGAIAAAGGFAAGTFLYPGPTTAEFHPVTYATTALLLNAACAHSSCTLQRTTPAPAGTAGTNTLPGGPESVPLAVGDNTITVATTSEDTTVTRSYEIRVRRRSNNANLASLSEAPVGFVASTPFSPALTVYATSVVNSVASLSSISASCAQPDCKISIAGAAAVASPATNAALPGLAVGDNAFAVVVTSEDTTATKTYTLNVRRMSNDADLSALTDNRGVVGGGFASGTTVYGPVTVGPAVTTVDISATCAHGSCTVSIGGVAATVGSATRNGVPVFAGLNSISVTVTSEDGSVVKVYTLQIDRQAAPDDPSAVSISDSLGAVSGFAPTTTVYGAPFVVVDAVTAVGAIDVRCAHPLCTIVIDNDLGSPHTANATLTAGWLPLPYGPTTVRINITSADATQSALYEIRYYRASGNADLATLYDSAGAVSASGGFAPATTVYGTGFTVSPTTASLAVLNATCANAKCSIDVAAVGVVQGSGAASALSLVTGANSFSVVVTSEDGTATRTYTVSIERTAGTSDATLSSLVDSTGAVSSLGPFGSAITAYGSPGAPFMVPASVTSIALITAACTDPYCTVAIGALPAEVGSTSTSAAYPLAPGTNKITVTVTASDTVSSAVYEFYIRVQSDDASLASLTDGFGVVSAFSAVVTSYGLGPPPFNVSEGTATLSSIDATCAHPGCSITYMSDSPETGTISRVVVPLAKGANALTISVTSEDGTNTIVYVVHILRMGSSDAALLTLATLPPLFPSLAPAFDPTITVYGTLNVPFSVTQLAWVNATANHTGASLTLSGASLGGSPIVTAAPNEHILGASAVPLAPGLNPFSIDVVSEGTLVTLSYTFSVRRMDNDASVLSVTDSLGATTASFNPAVFTYGPVTTTEATLANLTVTCGSPQCAVTVMGSAAGTGGAVVLGIPLGSPGTTTPVTVRIDAEDLSGTATYTILVRRPGVSAELVAIADDLSFFPAANFSSSTYTYRSDISPNGAAQVALAATCEHPGCLITIAGLPAVVSGASVTVPLFPAADEHVVSIVVVSENGAATRTYTLTLVRPSGAQSSSARVIDVLAPSPADKVTLGPSATFNPSVDPFSLIASADAPSSITAQLVCNYPCIVVATVATPSRLDAAVATPLSGFNDRFLLSLTFAAGVTSADPATLVTLSVSPNTALAPPDITLGTILGVLVARAAPDGSGGSGGGGGSGGVPVPTVGSILSIAPASGAPGTRVTLSGAGFAGFAIDTTRDAEVSSVALAGFPCATWVVLSDAQLVCIAGGGTGTGPVAVSWAEKKVPPSSETPSPTLSLALSPTNFTYTLPNTTALNGRPLVWFAEPARGPATGGQLVTVHGFNFGDGPGHVAEITFAGVPCGPGKHWVSAEVMTCVTPATPDLLPRAGPIRVTSIAGSSDLATAPVYTYDPPVASVVSVFPRELPVGGGGGDYFVTIRGVNFGVSEPSPFVIDIDGKPCVQSIWVSSTEALCEPPPGTEDGRDLDLRFNGILVGTGVGVRYGVPCQPLCGWNQLCVSGTCGPCFALYYGDRCEERWLNISVAGVGGVRVGKDPIDLLPTELHVLQRAVLSDPTAVVQRSKQALTARAELPRVADAMLLTAGGYVTTSEEGGYVDLDVILASGVGDVAVIVTVSDPLEATVEPSRIVFATAPSPQVARVRVRGVPDPSRDGPRRFDLTFAPDPTLAPASILNGDPDTPIGFVNLDAAAEIAAITPSAVVHTEGGIVTVKGSRWDLWVAFQVTGPGEPETARMNTTEYNRIMIQGKPYDSQAHILAPMEADQKAGVGVGVGAGRNDGVASDNHHGHGLGRERVLFGVSSSGGRQHLALEQVTTDAGEDAATVRLPPHPSTGYATLFMRNYDGTEMRLPGVLFYTTGCVKPGFLSVGTECAPCPEGAECPGGNRLWPLPGYWNPDEESGFVRRCVPKDACTGHRGGVTTAFACAPGYEGYSCSMCSPEFYKSPVGTCLPCPDNEFLLAYLIADVVLWTTFGLLGTLMRDRMAFSYVVMGVRAIQSLAGLGTMADEKTPRWAVTVIEVLQLFSGDYSFVRPDCISPVPHMEWMLANLAHTYAVSLPLFLFIGLGHLFTMRSRGRLPDDDPRKYYFADRALRCIPVMLTMSYLPVATLAIEALSCDPDRLVTRPDVVCFEGNHVISFAVACTLIIGQTIGYPLLVLRHLRKSTELLHTDERFMERWNFFYEFYNPAYPTFWIIEYPIMCIVAAGNSVLKPHVNYQMSISVAVFAYKLLYILVKRPFIDGITDVIQAVMALISLVLINLTFFSRHGLLDKLPIVRDALLAVIFGAFVVAIIAIAGYIVWLALTSTMRKLDKEARERENLGSLSRHDIDVYPGDEEMIDGDGVDGDGSGGDGDGVDGVDDGFMSATWKGIEGLFTSLFGGAEQLDAPDTQEMVQGEGVHEVPGDGDEAFVSARSQVTPDKDENMFGWLSSRLGFGGSPADTADNDDEGAGAMVAPNGEEDAAPPVELEVEK